MFGLKYFIWKITHRKQIKEYFAYLDEQAELLYEENLNYCKEQIEAKRKELESLND